MAERNGETRCPIFSQIFYKPPSLQRYMKKGLGFEIKRKVFHLTSLLYILIFYLMNKYYNKQIALLSIIFIFIFFVSLEFFRIIQKRKIPLFHLLFRSKEEGKLAGNIYFTLGAIIAFAVFDFRIAVAVLLMTTLGDMAAALFGIQFGKHWIKSIPHTAWEGIIAEFAVDVIIGFLILSNWWIILAMALTATFVETVFTHADDNLAIPIFAGFVGQVLLLIL